MKSILFTSGVVLSILFFSSCKKEANLGNPPDTVEKYDTVLSKYIELDTTRASGQDTTSIYTFTYDNLQRIKQISQVKKDFPGALPYYITTDFFYSGSGVLPFKTVEVDKEAITYVDTSFYTYSNGLVRSDSSVNYRVDNNELLFISTASFFVTGNDVFVKVKEFTSTSVAYEDSATLTITMQNGNIVAQQDPKNTITYSKQVKYDDKVNPFYKVDIHYPIFYEHLFNSFSAQKNNMTEVVDFTTSGTQSHVKYSYTYRADGYPLQVRKIDVLDPTENRKGLFFYGK
jgi:hypothetical protein